MNKTHSAMAIGMALAAAAPGHAQTAPSPAIAPVVIGVIDTRVTDTPRPGLDIVYKAFVDGRREGVEQINMKKTHGDVVVDMIAEARETMGDKRPYKVYAANPIVRTDDGGLAMSGKGLLASVDWFKENGVKVIATSFASKDATPAMLAFEAKAKQAGMTVVASVGNDGMSSVPYPAAFQDVVAIDGYHYRQPGSRQKDMFLGRADAVFNGITKERFHPDGVDRKEFQTGDLSMGTDRATAIQGSSFAAARAAAFLAANLGDAASFDTAKSLLARSYVKKGVPVRITYTPAVDAAPQVVASAEQQRRPNPAAIAAARGMGY